MTKSISIFSLLSLFVLLACNPQDIPLPSDPLGAEADTDHTTLLQKQYDGDEVPEKVEREAQCQYLGIVEVMNEEDCRYLIYLEREVVLSPVNLQEMSLKLYNGQHVILDFDETRDNMSRCTVGIPAKILCIREIRGNRK